MRSSRRQTTVAEVKKKFRKPNLKTEEKITSKFLTIAATTTAAMIYTAACKLIETNLF